MSTTTEESSQLPFSPFSDSTSVSDPTSDENPDLGQFNFVFRTLNHLQPHPWIPAFNGIYASEESTIAAPEGSTVWQQLPILSYLNFSSSELIIAPLEERGNYLQLAVADTSRTSSRSSQSEENDDDDSTVTVDISSNDGGLSPDSHSEEEEEEDGGMQVPLRWQSPLRAYSPAWDSEENADEFGPFDGATTASSGTRPTEDSIYNLPVYHPVVVYRDSTSTPSSVQDDPMSVTSLRTFSITSSTSSLPSFPAHDDNSYSALSDTYSLLERPASLPHVFSSPLNDNSTRSSYSASSSPPPFLLRSTSPPSDSLEHDISHQHSHSVQPQSSIPHHHLQYRRWTSGSGSTSTITSASTTTRATHIVNDPTQVLTSTSPVQAVHSQDNNSGSASSDISTPSASTSVSAVEVHDLFMDLHSIRNYGTAGSEDGAGDESLPSLGFLDEALKFIAEERAKWEASRDTGNVSGSLSSDSERWKNELGSDSARESNVTKSSASDLNLVRLSPNSRKKNNKKIKKMIKSAADISGAATPIVSILRPDGTIVGGGASDVNRKRRSLESSGSGTLTPRMGVGTWAQHDQINVTPKKGKDKGLARPRSVPQLKILTDPVDAVAAADERQQQQQGRERDVHQDVRVQAVAQRKHANVNIANAQTHAVNTKRARLQNLAKQLQGLFPDDRARLDYVLKSLQKQKLWKSKEKEKHKASESSGEDRIVFEDEDEELDPRGRPPRKGDPLVHVFIDHSNILFGLLAHLKRHPPRRPLPPTPANTKPVSSAPASPAGTDFTSIPSASTILPLPSFATARVRIPLEAEEHETSGRAAQVDNNPDAKTRRRVRHLSHTALSLILERGRPVTRRVLVTSSPLYQPMDGMERLGYQVSVFLRVPDLGDGMDRTERYRDRHHHHREISINRTSPTLARRKTHSGISKSSSSGSASGSVAIIPNKSSPRKNKSHTKPRPLSGGNGALGDMFHFGGRGGSGGGGGRRQQQQQQQDGSDVPASAPSSYNSTTTGALLHSAMLARASGSNGAGGTDSGAAVNGGATNGGGGNSTPHRIRFREQGVDELLQLKLHQALAAEDDVPEGATIVLATGDGNVGQFNEEGFLGPVRTALKRGWKVELYSWVGGLSRAWKREFGEDSVWGKSGKFRVIGMEQFASSLVEDGWVEV